MGESDYTHDTLDKETTPLEVADGDAIEQAKVCTLCQLNDDYGQDTLDKEHYPTLQRKKVRNDLQADFRRIDVSGI